ncbi:hypothetical protein ACNO5M_17425 [Vibrio owensii]|uniref:hypothetical protein n=1 Tax=Vibrio harveyi group TaxID=717610 RepID=UPI0015E2A0A7|nr:hypothetical protein [Vibrio jasicida]
MEYMALGIACLALVIAVLGNLYLEYEKNKAFKRVSFPVLGIHGKGRGIVLPKKQG